MENPYRLQDELTGALSGLARICTVHVKSDDTDRILAEGAACRSRTDDCDLLLRCLKAVRAEKQRIAPDCAFCPSPCLNAADYDMARLWSSPSSVREAKLAMLEAAGRLAACGRELTPEEMNLLYEAYFVLAEDRSPEDIDPVTRRITDALDR